MNDQNAQILEELSNTSDKELTKVFGEYYPQLINYLKSENDEDRLRTIDTIQRFFKCSNSAILDIRIRTQLLHSIRDLNTFFGENIVKIEGVLQSCSREYDLVVSLVNQNFKILISFGDLITQLTSPSVSLEYVDDILINVFTALLTTFRHCKDNENIYSQTTSSVNDNVTRLFRKCNELQILCLQFLNDVKIDCDCEGQRQSLITILYSVFDIGVVVSNLDLKTMAQLWKGFTSMLKTYATYLKDQFDVTKIIRFFYAEITEKMSSVYELDSKLRSLTLKILCFLLKIVVKLCEYFAENIQNACSDLYKLILALYQHSGYHSNASAEIANELERCLLPGVDPLISTLIQDRGFVTYLLSAGTKEGNSRNNVHLLLFLSVILQKLVLSSSEVQSLWFEFSIVEFVFTVVTACGKELCYDVRTTVPCSSASLPQEICLYDALIVHLSSLIISGLSCEQFHDFERLLISQLLSAPLLTKLFVSDLWCVIIRYGSSDLCYEHTEYLISVLHALHNEKIETVFLVSLIKRFFSCLSRSQQLNILNLVVGDRNLFLKLCDWKEMTSEATHSVVESSVSEITRAHCTPSSVELPNTDLMKSIAVVCNANATNPELNSRIRSFIVTSWSQLSHANVDDLGAFVKCVSYLCQISQAHHAQPTDILPQIEELLRCEATFLKLNVLKYFKSLAQYTVDERCTNKFVNSLGSLFRKLLKDKNPIVEQQALETFSYFSLTTKYEKIVQVAIANEPTLAENVSAYVQKRPRESRTQRQFEEYLEELFRPRSVDSICQHMKQVETFEIDDKPVDGQQIKKIKLNFNFEEDVERIESNVVNLLNNISTDGGLDSRQKAILSKMLATVNKLQRYL